MVRRVCAKPLGNLYDPQKNDKILIGKPMEWLVPPMVAGTATHFSPQPPVAQTAPPQSREGQERTNDLG